MGMAILRSQVYMRVKKTYTNHKRSPMGIHIMLRKSEDKLSEFRAPGVNTVSGVVALYFQFSDLKARTMGFRS